MYVHQNKLFFNGTFWAFVIGTAVIAAGEVRALLFSTRSPPTEWQKLGGILHFPQKQRGDEAGR